jgi:hypothetical protein
LRVARDFHGGFARRGGVDGLRRGGVAEPRANGKTVADGATTAGVPCVGAGEDDTVGWCASASPRSSHSDSDSESQNRPDEGRRTAAAVSISSKMNGSCPGG